MQEISSIRNPRIQALRALKEKGAREESRTFLMEGAKGVSEALALGRVRSLLVLREESERYAAMLSGAAPQVERLLVSRPVLEAVAYTRSPQGILAQVDMAEEPPLAGRWLLALDGVQDPGNVGTMLRTADAAGWDGLLLGRECADAYSPKVVSATMGSILRMPLWRDLSLPERLGGLRDAGYAIVATTLEGELIYRQSLPHDRVVLAIGSEARGLSEAVEDLSTHRVRLPMRGGAESLNAAVAAGICMYEWTREEEV